MSRLALVSAALILSALTQPVAAEPPGCTQRTDVVDHLASDYAEVPVAMGLVSNGGVIEVLSSRAGESWTTARAFLDAHNIAYEAARSAAALSSVDIAARARGFTVSVECRQ